MNLHSGAAAAGALVLASALALAGTSLALSTTGSDPTPVATPHGPTITVAVGADAPGDVPKVAALGSTGAVRVNDC